MRPDPRLIAVPVVLLVVGVTWIASTVAPSPAASVAAKSSVIAVRQANLVCPQAGGAADGDAARIAYADASTSDPGGSTLTAGGLGAGSVASAIPLLAGHGWVVDGPPALGPVAITVTGPVTDSLSAVQFTRAVANGEQQVSTAQCGSPTTDAWFAGFSSNVGAHATLLLSNTDTVPATVDVSIWGAQGGEPNIRRGISVDAHTQVEEPLDQIEPGLAVGIAHVVATAGRVVPALRADAENGSIPLGVDWLPPTASPATTQTVPGILGDIGPRRLIVGNPGTVDATFAVTVVTAEGAFMPTEFTSSTVDAGEVSDVSLDPVLQGDAAAIVVTSSQPVVAGGISTLPLDGAGGSDIAFTGAVAPLSGPTVVAGGEVGAGRQTQLVMSAPGDDAQVRIVILPSALDAVQVVTDMTVSGGTTTVLDLATLTTDPAPAVVAIPEGGGQLYAAWSLQENGADSSDLTELVLRTPVRTLARPPARFDPAAGLP